MPAHPFDAPPDLAARIVPEEEAAGQALAVGRDLPKLDRLDRILGEPIGNPADPDIAMVIDEVAEVPPFAAAAGKRRDSSKIPRESFAKSGAKSSATGPIPWASRLLPAAGILAMPGPLCPRP
jgi:hypothetical protein